MSEQRRTKYDIYADIVDVISRKGMCSMTRISYGSNLPVDRAKKSLELLVSHGFIKEFDARGRRQYGVTKWGLEYLETYRRMQKFFAALREPVTVDIPKTALPDRVKTGYGRLDDMLFGGLPENYAVVLSSPSCNEKDFLVKRFLEVGAKNGEATFYVTTNPGEAKDFAEKFQSNFYLLLCNPKADAIVKEASNIFKLTGVENLTGISIALTSAIRKLGPSLKEPRRICIDLVSDVLLQHHALQTRKWLTAITAELKSNGFTTLAVVDPRIHPSEELYAILGLFDGEIYICEKGAEQFLKIKRMSNQKYLDDELLLKEEDIQK